MKRLLPLFLATLFLISCQEDKTLDQNEEPPVVWEVLNLPDMPFNYANPDLPAHFFIPPILDSDNEPAANPVTDQGATLGRVLFYDVNLSANRTVSCASCHKQELGFSDDLVLSEGFEGGHTGRHSMALANARYFADESFFWDMRAATLEEQVLMPLQDEVEMGMTLEEVVRRVDSLSYYDELFENAFGDSMVSSERISGALAQFVRSLVSYQSRFDEGRALVNNPNAPFPNLTPAENRGKAIFFGPAGGCGPCHGTDVFIAPGPRNNGLDAVTTDLGLAGVTGRTQDEGLFKVPSLRNVAVRPPYMHDGRFATLEEVIDHYSTGVQDHPNLSPPLRILNGGVRNAQFTQGQKEDLIAFLHTLTDEPFLQDEKFSNPFEE